MVSHFKRTIRNRAQNVLESLTLTLRPLIKKNWLEVYFYLNKVFLIAQQALEQLYIESYFFIKLLLIF
jgi:hypothetical protein